MFTAQSLLLVMATTTFLLGVATFVTGILILALRAGGRDAQAIAVQATKLAQKGLAEDVAGLVGNASSLLDSMHQMVRTTAGVGVFLTILGLLLMGISFVLAIQVFQVQL